MAHTRNGKRGRKAQAETKMEATCDAVTAGVRKFADEVVTMAEKRVESAQGMASEYLSEGRTAIESVGSQLTSYVRAQPVKSLVLAAGAGILISMFLRRR